MVTSSPILRGCCSVFSVAPPTPLRSSARSLSPVPRPVTHLCLFPTPLVFLFSWRCCVVLATGLSLSRCLLLYSPFFPHRAASGPVARAPHHVLSPFTAYSPHPVFLFATRVPSSASLAPSCSPAAFSLCAVRSPAVLVRVFFCLSTPPFLLCFLPRGTLLPAHTQDSTAQVFWSRLLSVLASCPFALLGLAPRRSWPCQVNAPPSRPSPLVSPFSLVSRLYPYCCSPAPCGLSWSSPRQGRNSHAL